ncbi:MULTISPECIES: GvpL/GvpF family gas vesicle protein [unclassified Leptolyngbya]|uniref:gas vesicle protein GvpF n=1 Tax=unclassified Leptolyngbya TaxID=2650499 RepID=UPI00168563F1|nr:MULTISPECIES: GvpL/GvpF family gas vesicle protein [unclassified Leptolyngbya]MBD1913070.1 GvpL/GvpF family gas vesicle protein [Leptolyngbya sp. FACHB-8]MBD2154429.1 GvpL/GvpF family gas vesicle protein [Leptolyngbya sp. FACHB-16]
MGFGHYLYGIFPEPGPRHLALEGLDKQPVHAHSLDGFVFLYSEAQQERYLASRRNLLGHERVLEQAMEHGYRTLLPLQFGLIIDAWETVQTQLLNPQGETLRQLFIRLEGRREVGVKLSWESDRELETLMAENDALRQERDLLEGKTLSMDEIVRIGQAIEKAMEARKQEIIETFRQLLNPMAIAMVENDPMTESMIYNAAYLIPWDDELDFGHKIEELDHQFEGRLKIRYNNFTAPFNFAQLE